MIEKHIDALEKFGQVRFEITSVKMNRGIKHKHVYQLNEEQATLLISFLKNTEPVVKFKVELVKQFYAMKNELLKRQVLRESLKPIRRAMTDAIQESTSDPWAYKNYTNLAYKVTIGKNAAQLRKERGADKKANAVEYMRSDELEQITKAQDTISVLVSLGLDYYAVKDLLMQKVPARL